MSLYQNIRIADYTDISLS